MDQKEFGHGLTYAAFSSATVVTNIGLLKPVSENRLCKKVHDNKGNWTAMSEIQGHSGRLSWVFPVYFLSNTLMVHGDIFVGHHVFLIITIKEIKRDCFMISLILFYSLTSLVL